MKTIKSAISAQVSRLLNELLADEFILYTKTRNAHWNIEGKDFYEKHKFFEEQYRQLDTIVDDVAERIRTIGHYAPATLKEFQQLSRLTEQSRQKNDSFGFMKQLLSDHESIIIRLHENMNRSPKELQDSGTTDFMTGLMRIHEKMAWMLKSHL